MKLKTFLFIVAVIFASCTEKNVTDPLTYMDRRQQREVIDKFVRYATKLAPTSSRESMFNSQFDSYYDRAALELNFVHLQPAEDGGYYFLFSRPARSIIPMFEGVGGRLKLNEKDSLIEYEEVFRTWKMEDKDLKSRGKYLFNTMVKGEDLSPFYSKKAGDKYIEFPDDRFRFDKEKRRWMDTSTDTIEFFNKTDSITLNQ